MHIAHVHIDRLPSASNAVRFNHCYFVLLVLRTHPAVWPKKKKHAIFWWVRALAPYCCCCCDFLFLHIFVFSFSLLSFCIPSSFEYLISIWNFLNRIKRLPLLRCGLCRCKSLSLSLSIYVLSHSVSLVTRATSAFLFSRFASVSRWRAGSTWRCAAHDCEWSEAHNALCMIRICPAYMHDHVGGPKTTFEMDFSFSFSLLLLFLYVLLYLSTHSYAYNIQCIAHALKSYA